MPPVRFVPNTGAPTHLGNFRDVVTAESVPGPGVPLFPDSLGAASRVAVLAAWGADLNADSASWHWTDVTADVRMSRGVVLHHGGADESSETSPAECQFDLDNTTGNYSRGLATGAYYPYVRLGTPIQVIVNTGTDNNARFFGFANGFTPSWDTSANLATVNVSASGSLRRLGRGNAPVVSSMQRSILAANPVAYWPMEDESDATTIASGLAGGVSLTVVGTVNYAQASDLPGAKPVITFSSTSDVTAEIDHEFTGQWQIDYFLKIPQAGFGSETIIMRAFTDSAVALWDFVVGSGYNAIHGYGPTGTLLVDSGHQALPSTFLGQWNHIRFQVRDEGGGTLRWALTEAPITTNFVTFYDGTYSAAAGNLGSIIMGVREGADLSNVAMGHLAIYDDYDFSATDSSASGYTGEDVNQRLVRLSNEAGVAIDGPTFQGFETDAQLFGQNGTWIRDSTVAHSGMWSLRSANIGSNASTQVNFSVPASASTVNFWYKTSTEDGFDFLYYVRDGVATTLGSGEVGWTYASIDVTGVTTFGFRYTKDTLTIGGQDACWIDDLVFTGSSTLMGVQPIDDVVSLLRDCESADLGMLHDGFGPGLRYVSRESLYNQDACLTIDASLSQLAPPFSPVDDDQRIRNKYTVTRTGGSSATFEDSDGPLGTDAIGVFEGSATVNVSADSVLGQYAAWLVHLGTVEGLRYPRLLFDLRAHPELVPDWLTVMLGCRIDVTNIADRATQHPPETISLLVEGYTETISPIGWTVEANCSLYTPHEVGVLDTSGYLDCGASTLSEDLDTTETGVDVTARDECTWTHVDGDYNIFVDGEKMTVTAVNPIINDTFTRSVSNGWGTADTNGTWTTTGTASDFSVGGFEASIGISAVNSIRTVVQPFVFNDGEILLGKLVIGGGTVALGASISVGIVARYTDTSNYLLAELVYSTSDTVTARLVQNVGGSQTALSSSLVSGLTGSGTAFAIRFHFVGADVRMKVWNRAGSEPVGWTTSGTATHLAAGTAGIWQLLNVGNVNVLPVTYAYDDFQVVNPQTMTVTRSVNGVVKSHNSGAEVHVADPFVLAL